jgi:hypothetical protein
MMVSKYFKTLKQAETHQFRLYNRYDVVRLHSAPSFQEEGHYVWEVRKG